MLLICGLEEDLAAYLRGAVSKLGLEDEVVTYPDNRSNKVVANNIMLEQEAVSCFDDET